MTIALSELQAELDTKGYAHLKLFTPEELSTIRGYIRKTIEKGIGLNIADLGKYHANISEDQHRVMGTKVNRILTADQSDDVIAFESVQNVFRHMPGYIPMSVTYGRTGKEDRPEVYFRLVRPGKSSDVGSMHKDLWFHELYHSDFDKVSYKLWIAIEGAPGQNGLYIYPETREMDLHYKTVETPDGPRPVPDFDTANVGPEILVPTASGDAILFQDTLLHRGAINAADTTRVSVEITFAPVS
jgi:hypothetical protein